MKKLSVFLVLQLLAIVIAGLSFKIIDDRFTAGMVAGAYFILSGLYMVARDWPDARKWTQLHWYPLLVHAFVISLPMVITRLLHHADAWEDVKILGLAGPDFHRLSTTVFSILLIATLLDLGRAFYKIKKAA